MANVIDCRIMLHQGGVIGSSRVVILLSVLCLLFVPVLAVADWYDRSEAIMGTDISVSLWLEDESKAKRALDMVMQEMHRIDKALSPWLESSEISRLNQLAAAAPQVVSPELEFLLQKSLYYSSLSDGAFDITFASLGWYYDYRQKKRPSEAMEKALKPAINYHHVHMDMVKHQVSFGHPNVRVDLGGIAKGYAVDRAVAILQSYNVKHAAVSAGGDSRLLGDRKGRPWIIGIQHPRHPSKDGQKSSVLSMPLEDVAISTSGDYERYFIDESSGERVHHIMNPQTGRSATGLLSVSILGPQGVDTDALSTTVFVLGADRGLALINGLQDFDCVLIDDKGVIHYSQGLMPPST